LHVLHFDHILSSASTKPSLASVPSLSQAAAQSRCVVPAHCHTKSSGRAVVGSILREMRTVLVVALAGMNVHDSSRSVATPSDSLYVGDHSKFSVLFICSIPR